MSVPGLAHPPTLKESQMPSVLLQTDPAPKRCALETFAVGKMRELKLCEGIVSKHGGDLYDL